MVFLCLLQALLYLIPQFQLSKLEGKKDEERRGGEREGEERQERQNDRRNSKRRRKKGRRHDVIVIFNVHQSHSHNINRYVSVNVVLWAVLEIGILLFFLHKFIYSLFPKVCLTHHYTHRLHILHTCSLLLLLLLLILIVRSFARPTDAVSNG